jgi:hypothetical protein
VANKDPQTKAGEMVRVVKCLPSKHKALSSNSSTVKKTKILKLGVLKAHKTLVWRSAVWSLNALVLNNAGIYGM